jgi:putative transposase
VDEHRDRFDVESIYRVIDFAVSTYYAAKKRASSPSAREPRDADLIPLIRAAWEDSRRLYGARKIWKQLRREGVEVARCTVERLMRAGGMSGVVAKRARPRTTVPGDPLYGLCRSKLGFGS